MAVVGGYTMHLYCDSGLDQPYADERHDRILGHHGEPGQFLGKNLTECRRKARKAGWFITGSNQNTVTCPRCAAEWNKVRVGLCLSPPK